MTIRLLLNTWFATPILFICSLFFAHSIVAQPSLVSSTLFGGPGDQYGQAIAIQGNQAYVGGYINGPLARFEIPLAQGAMPVWSGTLNGVEFFGITLSPSTVYVAGVATPPACGSVDNVGDVEGKTLWGRYDLTTGNFLDCHSTNFFPYSGQEAFQGSVTDGTFIFAAGFAETCGFGNNTFLLSKFDLTGTLLQTVVEVGVSFGQFNCLGDSHARGLALFNGNLYMVGASNLTGEDGVLRPVLLKYDTNLNRIWKVRPSGDAGTFNAATAFGGAIYAVGSVTDNSGDFLVEKYDESGNRIWSMKSGGSGDDELWGVVGLGSSLYAVGFTTSQGAGGQDIVILEIDPNTGNTLSTTLFGGAYDDGARGAATDGTDLYVVGNSKSFATPQGNLIGQSDIVLLRYQVVKPPLMTIAKSHSGNFRQGQQNAAYQVTVTNGASAGPTSGTVTVTENVPAGLTLVSMTGSGWACPGTAANNCTRSDVLNGGESYPPITVTVDVANNAPASVTNSVALSGGGAPDASANDPTQIVPVADLTIQKTHSGYFVQGQTGVYTITVANSGVGPTLGSVNVTDSLPSSLIALAMTGSGWTCDVNTMSCTRPDVLAARIELSAHQPDRFGRKRCASERDKHRSGIGWRRIERRE